MERRVEIRSRTKLYEGETSEGLSGQREERGSKNREREKREGEVSRAEARDKRGGRVEELEERNKAIFGGGNVK